jgi:hypothetical protein
LEKIQENLVKRRERRSQKEAEKRKTLENIEYQEWSFDRPRMSFGQQKRGGLNTSALQREGAEKEEFGFGNASGINFDDRRSLEEKVRKLGQKMALLESQKSAHRLKMCQHRDMMAKGTFMLI